MSVNLIRGVLPPERCDEVVEFIKKYDWTDGVAHDKDYCAKVKRNRELRGEDPRVKSLLKDLQTHIWKDESFNSTVFPLKATTLRFNRYSEGECYASHADAALMGVPPIRSDFSLTLFLTDDYDGGDLKFAEHTIKGMRGDLVVYPSHYIHEVTPVTKGERICAIAWVQSLIRESLSRETMTRFYQLGLEMKERDHLSDLYTEAVSIYNNFLRTLSET